MVREKNTDRLDAASVPSVAAPLGSSSEPKITVVMAAYNAIDFIEHAVESILNQTLTSWRMIIVDDGSTDGTGQWLDQIDDSRVMVIHQENQGQQAAANRAIEMCDTEFILRFDADDISMPNRLQWQLDFMNENPDVGMLGGQFSYLGDATNIDVPAQISSKLPQTHDAIFEELINNRHAFCNSTSIFRRELFAQVGGYWKHNISEDWDFFLRVGETTKLANLNEPLIWFRFPTTSINGSRMFESQLYNEYACELARRRADGRPSISFDSFWSGHRYRKWPMSVIFKLECYAVSQYRVALTSILNGQPIAGYSRMLYAMLCAPTRSLHRIMRIFGRKTEASAVS